jgi:hypothetical protein
MESEEKSEEDGGFVQTVRGERIAARIVTERERHVILRTRDGQAAKIVKGSGDRTLRTLESIRARNRRIRNLAEWRYLRGKTHPGLLRVGERVVDARRDEGFLCEWLDTPSLAAEPAFVSSMESYLCSAIVLAQAAGELHRDGYVHGDITPANACLRDGVPVLIDFEMSIRIGQYLSDNPGRFSNVFSATPSCCSPEQVRGLRIFPTSDVYCLGLTFLSWVSGYSGVWGDEQTVQRALRMCGRAQYPYWEIVVERLGNLAVVDVLRRSISLKPRDRFKDGYEFALALEDALDAMSVADRERPIMKPCIGKAPT